MHNTLYRSVPLFSHLMFNLGSYFSSMCLFFTIVIAMGASSVWQIWACMEFNLLFFVYWACFCSPTNSKTLELGLIYFLVQSSSSLGVFWGLIVTEFSSEWGSVMVMVLLFLKLGLFPFHYWVIFLSDFLSHFMFYILMFFQKIIPLLLLRFSYMTDFFILLNLLASLLLSFNELGVVKMLVYSSMFNMAWFLLVFPKEMGLSLLFYLVYGVNLGSLMACLPGSYLFGMDYWAANASLIVKMAVVLSFLSLAGFPGTIGFYLKIMMSMEISKLSAMFVVSLMTSSVLISYLYIRVFLSLLSSKPMGLAAGFNSNKTLCALSAMVMISPLSWVWVILHAIKGFEPLTLIK